MPSRTLDWDSIKSRLAAAATAVAGGIVERSPEENRRILEARARAAAKPEAVPDEVERLDVLVFSLAGESYGIETRHVRESCQLKELTPLPCTPPFVAGVMSLRGRVLAIVDLRRFFGLPAGGLTDLNRVIVIRDNDEYALGLLADSVDGVHSVKETDLQPGLPTLTGVREKFLVGVTGGALAVLDGARLVADASLKVNENVNK